MAVSRLGQENARVEAGGRPLGQAPDLAERKWSK
jgi:hypothetical protein